MNASGRDSRLHIRSKLYLPLSQIIGSISHVLLTTLNDFKLIKSPLFRPHATPHHHQTKVKKLLIPVYKELCFFSLWIFYWYFQLYYIRVFPYIITLEAKKLHHLKFLRKSVLKCHKKIVFNPFWNLLTNKCDVLLFKSESTKFC